MYLRTILVFLALSLGASTAAAHNLGQSYVYLRVFDQRMEVRVEIAAPDLDRALGLSLYADEQLTRDEATPHLDAILAYVEQHLDLEAEGKRLDLGFQDYEVLDVGFIEFLLLTYEVENIDTVPELLDVTYDVLFDIDREHVNMLVIEHYWKAATFNNESNVSLVFTPPNRQQTLNLSGPTVWDGFVGLIKLGVWHIWIGLDHILFLLALILPSVLFLERRRWEPVASFRPAFMNIVAIVTFFTIAHSITLSLAALDVIRLPSRLVESIIAGSIAVAALHNLFPRLEVREWMIAFGFGLFHGFGFASVMGDIGLGQERLALSVLGFNVGVEIGQIAIIALIFPILYLLRTNRWYRPVVLRLGSVALIGMASLWLFERLFDVSFMFHIRRVLATLSL